MKTDTNNTKKRRVRFSQSQRRTGKRTQGFTLIEVLMVVALLLVAAAMMVPMISSASSTQALAAADQLLADLEYAKNLAITQGQNYEVAFDMSSESYQIQDSDGDVIDHPVKKGQDFIVSFPDSQMANVEIVTVDFDGTSTVAFDPLGSPFNGNGTPLDSGTVSLSAGSLTKTVSVQAVTGYTSID